MIKGSKHTPETIEKFRIAKLGKPGNPHKKGVPISKNATIICIDCGSVIPGTTTNRKRCPECKATASRKRTRMFKKEHAAEVRKANNEYYKRIRSECPERVKELGLRFKQWYEKNKEYCRDQARKYRQDHPEHREKKRQYEKDHPEIKRASETRRRALKHNAYGFHTRDEFHILCESTGWQCSYCGGSLTKKTASEDHIIALSRGGSDSIENIAPACAGCNRRKNAKSAKEYSEYLRKAEAV